MKVTSILKSSLTAIMMASMLAVGSWADDDDRGGRGGGRGGGGSERSSRSFSGGSERSSRSFSGGGDRSSRSFSGQSRSSRGDSGRSYSRGDSDRSSRSFSQGSRSFSDQSRSRSFEGQQYSRGSDRGSSQSRSYSRPSDSDRTRQAYRPQGRESFQSDQFRGRSNDGRNITRDSSQGQRGIDQSRQQYQARRPSEDQVRDFLQMRDGRGDSDDRRADVARRLDSQRRGDDDNRNVADRNRSDLERRDSFRDGDFRGREGDFQRRDFDRDRDGRDFAGRDRDGRGGDRDYQRWREGAWSRDRDDDNRDWSGKWRDGDRFASARRIRDHWRDRDFDDDDFPFHGRWWGRGDHWHGHHGDWWGHYAHRHNRPFYWWTWSDSPRLSAWVTFGWPRPYYWDYGHGEYIYHDDGVIYVNGRWYQPAPVFYERTVEIVDRAPDLTPEQAAQLEWLPLGVFAVARDGSTQADVLVQLAVTKDGVIGGTAFDQRSEAAYPIEGMVDRETQRAVWSFTNDRNQRILMETSIYNLTQPEATGLVHYSPDNIQVVELVRLEQPEGAAAAKAELPAP